LAEHKRDVKKLKYWNRTKKLRCYRKWGTNGSLYRLKERTRLGLIKIIKVIKARHAAARCACA